MTPGQRAGIQAAQAAENLGATHLDLMQQKLALSRMQNKRLEGLLDVAQLCKSALEAAVKREPFKGVGPDQPPDRNEVQSKADEEDGQRFMARVRNAKGSKKPRRPRGT